MTVPFRLALAKMSPRELLGNPVLLVVEIGAVVTTVATVLDASLFSVSITVWLWLTVLFGTLAEAVAEGRGKAQAASLRNLQQTTTARRVAVGAGRAARPGELATLPVEEVPSGSLRAGDVVVVEAGDASPVTATYRGRGHRRRVRGHRRVRAGDP